MRSVFAALALVFAVAAPGSRAHALDGAAGALAAAPAQAESVTASWYGAGHHGKRTALGERFDMRERTCAHKWLPFGTRLEVCRNGKCTICRVNDRGPYIRGRALDLSHAAARAIGMSGLAAVTRAVM